MQSLQSCEVAKKKYTPVCKHKCVQNWPTNGSSKSMDSAAILLMAYTSVDKRAFIMHWIVSDDDNVMRAHLRHPDPINKKDKGKLPKCVNEPTPHG